MYELWNQPHYIYFVNSSSFLWWECLKLILRNFEISSTLLQTVSNMCNRFQKGYYFFLTETFYLVTMSLLFLNFLLPSAKKILIVLYTIIHIHTHIYMYIILFYWYMLAIHKHFLPDGSQWMCITHGHSLFFLLLFCLSFSLSLGLSIAKDLHPYSPFAFIFFFIYILGVSY